MMEFTTYTWTTHDSQPETTTHLGVERDGSIYLMMVTWTARDVVEITMHYGLARVHFKRVDGTWMEEEGEGEWTTALRKDSARCDEVESCMMASHGAALRRMIED